MRLMEIFWDDVPYVVLAAAAVGTWWRYRYDKFGWTTRSSQIYESKLLSIGSPLFHFGSLLVIVGHVMGFGIGLLIYRRRKHGAVFLATTRNDKLMYLVLACALVAGLCCTLAGATHFGGLHDYRQKVSVWFRSIWLLDPRGDLMAHAAFYYQIHVVIALALFALWPFTRLVHAFSAPIGYLFRPYIVYRSRDVADTHELIGSVPRRRGW